MGPTSHLLVKCYDHTSEFYMWVKCQLTYLTEQAASLLSRTPQFLILNIKHNKPSCTYLLSKLTLYVLYHRTVVDFYYAWKCWEVISSPEICASLLIFVFICHCIVNSLHSYSSGLYSFSMCVCVFNIFLCCV
jgi:hypothetical protein